MTAPPPSIIMDPCQHVQAGSSSSSALAMAVERVVEVTREQATQQLAHESQIERMLRLIALRSQRLLLRSCWEALRRHHATAAASDSTAKDAVALVVRLKQQQASSELESEARLIHALGLLSNRGRRAADHRLARGCLMALWRNAAAQRADRASEQGFRLDHELSKTAELANRDAALRVEAKQATQDARDAQVALAVARSRIAELEAEVAAAKEAVKATAAAAAAATAAASTAPSAPSPCHEPSRPVARRVAFAVEADGSEGAARSTSTVELSQDAPSAADGAHGRVLTLADAVTPPQQVARRWLLGASRSPDPRTGSTVWELSPDEPRCAEETRQAIVDLEKDDKENRPMGAVASDSGWARARAKLQEERRRLWVRHNVGRGLLQEALDLGRDGTEYRPARDKIQRLRGVNLNDAAAKPKAKRPPMVTLTRPGGQEVHYV